ncbi:MAG TPA: hypothetical protein VLF66_14875 [Thermoanaerobaculia bacterium]|nr:hypothetical protein [Thermoanaerobaculia bacterium]
MRQAVVVIHGIGEQRPLSTIRSFLTAITDGLVRSKPDRLSESFELRRFTLPETRTLPLTDVYELYWAHHMDRARWSAALRWIWHLLFRRTSTVPRGLRPVHRALWILLLLAAAATAVSALRAFGEEGAGLRSFATSAITYAPVAVFLGQWLFGRMVLGYLGDAARYLTPEPANIEVRNKIRSEGARLLRRLHEARTYSRIVVVGHSLGSVIGYDVLRHLWDELRWPSFEREAHQPEATAFQAAIEAVEHPPEGTTAGAAVERFQQAQHRLWREQRSLGTPWLVTDFVTLGSPLAHAELLLEDPLITLKERKAQRELPTCPPNSDGEEAHYGETREIGGTNPPRKWFFRIPNHGAVFSGTRWTNLYFPHRRLALGDIVGGPLTEVFGVGIRDVAVRPSCRGVWARTLACHTMYWRRSTPAVREDCATRKAKDRKTGTKDAIVALRSALALGAKRSKEKWPDP